MMKREQGPGLGARGDCTRKVERAKYLLGVAEGCKQGLQKGFALARREIGMRLLRETGLSEQEVAGLIGFNASQMKGLAK